MLDLVFSAIIFALTTLLTREDEMTRNWSMVVNRLRIASSFLLACAALAGAVLVDDHTAYFGYLLLFFVACLVLSEHLSQQAV